jgi:hypothetical protein
MTLKYTEGGQVYAAAFGGLKAGVQLYLDGQRTKQQLADDLAEAIGIVDRFHEEEGVEI